MQIILIGYRGSGKTSVGRALSSKLNVPFFDTDEQASILSGQSIPEMLKHNTLRNFETKAIENALAVKDCVIATGGGCVESPDSYNLLSNCTGEIVYLECGADELYRRIVADCNPRPDLMMGGIKEVKTLLKKREPLYLELADYITDVEKRVIEDIANDILVTREIF